uniref:Uncharacterized protein n=1 Tax=Phaeomonas parva TaxID=124430 RepID=A0A7S1UFK8_9STRA|mmetsp:Transcript_45986/g.143893  ORF Transcript_45986/g.143893 Transcript_45986/m.143893 type:complete len:618 (+) Transcript_45986:407-2260(+)
MAAEEDPFAEAMYESEAVAVLVVDELVSAACAAAYENHMAELEVKEVARAAVITVDRMLAWAFTPCDNDGLPSAPETAPTWAPSYEPEQVLIDRWARSAIPSKPRFGHMRHLVMHSVDGDSQSDAGSVRSKRSQSSHRSGVSTRGRRRKAEPVEAQPSPINEGLDDDERLAAEQLSRAFDDGEEGEYVPDMEGAEKWRTDLEAEQMRIEAERQEAKARFDEAVEALRGQPYTVDARGEVIPIAAVNTDKLNRTHSQNVNVEVHNYDEFLDSRSPQSRGRSMGSPSRGGSSRSPARDTTRSSGARTGRSGKSRRSSQGQGRSRMRSMLKANGAREVHYVVSPSRQPSMMTTMNIKAGVSLKEGSASRKGPLPDEDPDRMSRAAFFQRQERNHYEGMSTISSEMLSDVGDALDEDSIASTPSKGRGESREFTASRLPQYDTIDPFVGAQPQSESPVGDDVYNEDEDPHYQLYKSGFTAGPGGVEQAPARRGNKPNPKQQEVVYKLQNAPHPKLPRNRMPVDLVVPTGKGKRLPAPPLGKTTGHGGHGLGSQEDDDFFLDGDDDAGSLDSHRRSMRSNKSAMSMTAPFTSPKNENTGSISYSHPAGPRAVRSLYAPSSRS